MCIRDRGFLSGKVCRHGVQDALQRGPDIRRVQDQPGCVGVTDVYKRQTYPNRARRDR